jgi:Fic family protein
MKTKDITPTEYAKMRGCTLQNVTKQIRKGKSLPYVIRVKKFGRFYLLEIAA